MHAQSKFWEIKPNASLFVGFKMGNPWQWALRNVVLLGCVAIFTSALYAQNNSIRFKRLSIADGLSQSAVSCILQDGRGFMWFGTEDGLNRYDGYKFKVYKHDPMNPASMSNNYVKAVCEDRGEKRNVIWVGTYGGGLNKFDRETEQFTRYQAASDNASGLSSNYANCIYQDRSGIVWIGTDDGLNKFDPESESFIHYRRESTNRNWISNEKIVSVCEDSTGLLWLGMEDGLCAFHPKTETFISFRNQRQTFHNKRATAIFKDQSSRVWVGTSEGLYTFHPPKETVVHYTSNADNPNTLSDNRILSLYQDRSGALWVGTENGLNRMDSKTKTFTRYENDISNSKSLINNQVLSIFEDRSGVLWVGTQAGLSTYDQQEKRFVHYQSTPNNPNSLSNNIVRSILEDRDGQVLWIGTFGGLNRFDREKEKFIFYQADPNDPNSLSNNHVMSLCEDQDENGKMLWIGTSSGLDRLNVKKQQFTHFHFNPRNPHGLSSDLVRVVYKDRSGTLWVGTENGLNQYDRTKTRFIRYKYDPDDSTSLSNNFVYSIFEDQSGVLWVGTVNGLNQLNRGTNSGETARFIRYHADPSDPGGLSSNEIFSIYEARSGDIWIGTPSGLNKFNRAKKIFTHYTERDGLPNNLIYAILEDEGGCLWLSTNRGLAKFDPKTEVFSNYDVEDGLQSNEFNLGAFFRSPGGEMFFGGINGLNSFYPDSIRNNPYIPQIAITDFQIFNRSIPIGEEGRGGRIILKKSIIETDAMRLSYKDRVLSFEFAALHYSSPTKNRYAYKLEGFEKDWNEVGNRHFATYTNLPPRNYIFRVKGSNNDGVWNEKGIALKLVVVPPFWQTWWFRMCGILSMLLLIFMVYQIRINTIRVRSRRLEEINTELNRQIAERERVEQALQDAHHKLEIRVDERTAELRNINNELHAEIAARKIVEKRQARLLRELKSANSELKEFAYVVSHDLKAPLRAIGSLTDWMATDYQDKFDEEGKEMLGILLGRVKRMNRLIDGILQYSRIGRVKEEKQKVNLNKLLREVIDTVAPPENITVSIEKRLPTVICERTRIAQVFQNLIGNAVKYMDKPKGKISIVCDSKNGFWMFGVRDNGPGINEKYFDKIFKIFQTLVPRDEFESTGIGLSLVKKIVEMYGGKVWVESKVGFGSDFYFTLPKA